MQKLIQIIYTTILFFLLFTQKLLKEKKNISIIDDEYFSPLHIEDLIKTVKYVIKNNVSILNVGGPERKSRLDCVNRFLEILDINTVVIDFYKRKITDNGVIIPKDVSFNTNKLREFNRNMITIDSFLKKI